MKNYNFGKCYQGKVPGILWEYATKGINLVREVREGFSEEGMIELSIWRNSKLLGRVLWRKGDVEEYSSQKEYQV